MQAYVTGATEPSDGVELPVDQYRVCDADLTTSAP